MRPLSTAMAALILAFAGFPAAAQDGPVIRPGHEALDTTPVRAGVDSLAMFYFDGDDVFAIGTSVIEIAIEDGRITRAERMLGVNDELIWGEVQEVIDGSLTLVRASALGDRTDELSIADGHASRRWVDESEHDVRGLLEGPVFYAGALDLILKSLPLEEGYAATLVVLDPETFSEVRVPIHVARAVSLSDANGTPYRTWEVHVNLDGARDVYHFEQETHALIRFESAMESLVMLRW